MVSEGFFVGPSLLLPELDLGNEHASVGHVRDGCVDALKRFSDDLEAADGLTVPISTCVYIAVVLDQCGPCHEDLIVGAQRPTISDLIPPWGPAERTIGTTLASPV